MAPGTPQAISGPRLPATLRGLIALVRSEPDLRPALVTSVLLRLAELPIRLLPGTATTFFDPRAFPWTVPVEAGWPLIRRELDRILLTPADIPGFEDVQTAQRLLTSDGRWKTYVFYGCGHRNERNVAACPETARLLGTIPGLQTAFFSILEPGKSLPAHRGPYKGVLRYHLGLLVPSTDTERCGIRVGDDVRPWAEGGSLVFDDSHTHEAWNHTDQTRAVLFVDFLRPLPFPLAWINRRVATRLGRARSVLHGIGRLEAWNERVAGHTPVL